MKITQTVNYDEDGVMQYLKVRIGVDVHRADACIIAEDADPGVVKRRLILAVEQVKRELDLALASLLLEGEE